MDQGTINVIILLSCLLGIAVGWALVRWSQRQLALMASERQVLLKGRLGLWGRRVHARALLAGGAALLAFGVLGLFDLAFRR